MNKVFKLIAACGLVCSLAEAKEGFYSGTTAGMGSLLGEAFIVDVDVASVPVVGGGIKSFSKSKGGLTWSALVGYDDIKLGKLNLFAEAGASLGNAQIKESNVSVPAFVPGTIVDAINNIQLRRVSSFFFNLGHTSPICNGWNFDVKIGAEWASYRFNFNSSNTNHTAISFKKLKMLVVPGVRLRFDVTENLSLYLGYDCGIGSAYSFDLGIKNFNPGVTEKVEVNPAYQEIKLGITYKI